MQEGNDFFLVDSHCHLNLPDIKNRLSDVLLNAVAANIKYLNTVATKIDEINDVLEIANSNPQVLASLGIHPCNVKSMKDCLSAQEIIELYMGPNKTINPAKVIGIGETGLDYYRTDFDQLAQKKSFENHIEAAANSKKTLVIHTRNAENDTFDILSNHKNLNLSAVIHCFTGTKEFARKILDLGYYISISGIITFKNATDLCDIVKWLPLDRVLVETDAPYLAPEPFRGKSNEPAFVKFVSHKIAEIKGIDYSKVAESTSKNFFLAFPSANEYAYSMRNTIVE